MSIAFRCPQCGKEYTADDQMAGKGMKCRTCGGIVRIPSASQAKPPGSSAAAKSAPSRPSAPAKPASAPKPAAPAPPAAKAKTEEPPPPPSLDLYGLEDEPSTAMKAAAGPSAEEEVLAPLLPRAGTFEPPKPKNKGKGKKKEKEKAASSSRGGGFSFSLPGLAGMGGFGVSFVTAFMFVRWGCRIMRVARVVSNAASSSAPEEPSVRRPPRTNVQITSPAFPDLGPSVVQEGGILLHEVRLGPDNTAPKNPGHRGRLWIYLPPGDHAEKSLPCILMAGAGDDPTMGALLQAGDRQFHLAYARNGFAVVAYETDGALVNPDNAEEEDEAKAVEAFLVAKAGLVNARNAMDYVTSKVPQIDTKQFYSAGFASAGTMALRLAESDYRIKACMAFSADVDTSSNFGPEERSRLAKMVSGSGELFTTYNPKMHAPDLKCPTFLFYAMLPGGELDPAMLAFKTELEKLQKPVVLENSAVEEPIGAAMTHGIPRAVTWLKGLPAGGP
jgi:dienelactone hydrolase